MSRIPPLGESETARTACARGLLRAGVVEKTGEVLSAAVLAQRVGWAADLVSGMAADLLSLHWNTVDVDLLASGVDGAGRGLPSNAWMALRRLGWSTAPAEGVPSSVIRSRTRQIAVFADGHSRMPVDVFDLEAAPRAARMLLLSACDGQQASIARCDDPGRALLRVQLPARPDPRSYADWIWVACPITLPPTVPTGAVLHLPALRVRSGRVHADLAYTHTVPKARRTGHTIALGVDWGLNTLLSAGSLRLDDNGTITALGSGAQFRAAGVLARQHRLRRQGEELHAKTDQYQRLIGDADNHRLTGKHAVLAEEVRHVSNRRSNLNDALAWAAARWTVDQAVTARASVIYVEDLRSLEARGMGRILNTRLSQQIRGQIVERVRHLAVEAGIAVVTVPARGTSRYCPHCLVPLRHCKAPDRPTTPGWKWALCPNPDCGWQGDRDTGAWQRIAARGLTHQTKTVVDRTSGTMVIHSVVDKLETAAAVASATTETCRDRSKSGPTRRTTPRPAPRRRRAPSPAAPWGPAGKRPEGHAHTGPRRLPRAAHRHQGVATISTPTIRRHRPTGAALDAGFHLHAHATPPRWAEPIRNRMVRTGSLN